MRAASKSLLQRCRAAILVFASALSIALPAHAATLSIPDTPLFLTTSVTPNVMLMIDNSGSMNNIIWDTAYNPDTRYPDYSTNTCGQFGYNGRGELVHRGNQRCWTPEDGNLIRNVDDNHYFPGVTGERGSCNSGYREGRLNATGTARCLRLPDPVGGGGTRYSGNYLNFLFDTKVTDGTQTDLSTLIPNDFRLAVAKSVADNLVRDNSNLRFGITVFNQPTTDRDGNLVSGAPGGRVTANCGSAEATLLTAIDNLRAETNTPLAETFYEVTRYFRGMTSYFNSGTTYTSPIQYRCQRNFTIVITDGLPTRDTEIPTNDPDDVADTARALPNWDNLAPTTAATDFPNYPQYSDGFAPNSTVNSALEGSEAATLLLDDVVKFGNEIDLRKSPATDLSGKSFDASDYPTQNLVTYTVGFAVKAQMLQDAANYGDGQYFTANNAAQLRTSLQAAIKDIQTRVSAASSVALNSGFLDAGSTVFQARFNSARWSGELLAYPISRGTCGATATAVGRLCPLAWNAGTELNSLAPTDRKIMTYKPSTKDGTSFRWASLDTSQQALLNVNPDTAPTVDTAGSARLDYLRGSRSSEAATASPLMRLRTNVLGDMINSDPFFVGAPSFAYSFAGYSTFRNTWRSRTGIVYVGANDGMLHGFRVSDGRELLAYVPSKMYGTAAKPKLSLLTKVDYVHQHGVDGSVTVGDAQVTTGGTTAWKSVLVGGLRAGGQGLFALDVTDPSKFTEAAADTASTVMWEFNDTDDPDLGLTFSQPSIVKMKNGKWAAIIGNGYNNTDADGAMSTTGKAALYIIYLDGPNSTNGSWGPASATDTSCLTGSCSTPYYRKIVVNSGSATSPNGLATPAPVDVDGDSIIDYIYAGDLNGNMWRFDVTNADAANWAVSYSGSPMYVAKDSSSNLLPITTKPEVGLNLLTTSSTTDLIVYFGTGRYIETADNSVTSQRTQSFFGIFDDPAATTPLASGRSVLQSQSILQEVTLNSSRYRVTSQNTLDIATKKGWFMDLKVGSSGNGGERQVTNPILRTGRIIFTTLIPSAEICEFGGTGWLMEVDAKTGARLSTSPFDTNNDATFSANDMLNVTIDGGDVTVAASGVQSTVGIMPRPTILAIPGNQEIKYAGGSSGDISTTRESAAGRLGRLTWRELIP